MKLSSIFLCLWLLLIAALYHTSAQAQGNENTRVLRAGVFVPLYLDSVFNKAGYFKYSEGIPKFITSSLDFVNGFRVGLDSIIANDNKLEVRFYDTKSYKEPLASLIKNHKLDSLDLLISPAKDMEYRQLADFAQKRHIPFVSVAYPNDGGITENPFVIILNSTLRAHCEAIFSYILQDHGSDNVLLCRKNGQQEDRVANYIRTINEQDGKSLIKINTLNFDSTIDALQLARKLDSTKNNIVLGGSLDESFALGLSYACNEVSKTYPITLIGMPNWDGFRKLKRRGELDEFPIYFTTPYFNTKRDPYSRILIHEYKKRWKGYPSDMAFKGFESALIFLRMLVEHPSDFLNQLNNPAYRFINDYNFKPVSNKLSNAAPDYFENKHLYFIKLLNGVFTLAW